MNEEVIKEGEVIEASLEDSNPEVQAEYKDGVPVVLYEGVL